MCFKVKFKVHIGWSSVNLHDSSCNQGRVSLYLFDCMLSPQILWSVHILSLLNILTTLSSFEDVLLIIKRINKLSWSGFTHTCQLSTLIKRAFTCQWFWPWTPIRRAFCIIIQLRTVKIVWIHNISNKALHVWHDYNSVCAKKYRYSVVLTITRPSPRSIWSVRDKISATVLKQLYIPL